MARSSYRGSNIPSGIDSPIYLDAHQIAKGVGAALGEAFIGQVTGAGGAGGSFVCPFEPGVMVVSEETGPTLELHVHASTGDVEVSMITGAASANAVTVTAVGDGTFTVALPTALAPDADVATVVCLGVSTPTSL